MKYIRILIPVLMVMLAFEKMTAQTDYREDENFFLAQVPVFEQWLASQSLDSFFIFESQPLKLESDNLMLKLKFQVSGIVESINAIRQLNAAYLAQSGFTLEEAFFQKAVHLFEMPPADIQVKVESIPAKGDPAGVVSILQYQKNYETGTFEISPFSFLRSEVKDSVIIQDFVLPEQFMLPTEMAIDEREYRQKEYEICSYLLQKIRSYFGSRGEVFDEYPTSNTVRFQIKNLKNEVVEGGYFQIFDPHEKLKFTIKVLSFEGKGLKVFTTIDGKYGPGFYRPRSGDYHEMDPKYLPDLQEYTARFTRMQLRNWLLNTP